MKHKLFIFIASFICINAFAEKKTDKLDNNKWNWIEGSDKYQTVAIEDGYMVLKANKKNKKASDYQNCAKTFCKLPIRGKDNYNLSIKCEVPEYNAKSIFTVFFNTDKKCMDDEEGNGTFSTAYIMMVGNYWLLTLPDGRVLKDKLPGKLKKADNFPFEFNIVKKGKNVTIEINGIQIFDDEYIMTEPCIGFMVPIDNSLKIDEVSVEQASEDD
ncbi:MAG: hypothetical protein IJ756_09410 [Paludibacteraceae bacterium]|nr:hypothetical protein [Paludibacteraceae bacterium]